MKSTTWRKWNRGLASGLIGVTSILGTILTVQASEAQAPAPKISQWSIQTLNEGEKYGIYPMAWYYDEAFQQAIAADKLQSLVNATSAKLEKLGFSKTGTFTLPTYTTPITREAVLKALYDVLAQYELPESFEIKKYAPVEYLQNKHIVNGTGNGLELDRLCTTEQAAVMASRLVEYAYDTAEAGAEGLLWKAANGNNTLYLLGSIHLGDPAMYPMRKSVRDAFNASESLWVEVNLLSENKEGLDYFNKLTTYSDGTTLKDHVSQETYDKLNKVTDRLENPKGMFDSYKPWVVSNNVSMNSLMSASEDLATAAATGIDMYFLQKAMLGGKPVQELEGLKFQGDLFNNVPAADQEKELNVALDSVLNPSPANDEAVKAFKEWQQQWAKGDLNGFTESFTASKQMMETESAKRLFGERDRNMADKLSKLLEQEGGSTSFVVVGAGHFVIKDMVIDQLKQKGYHVEFVQ